jgi:hypothetical protein
MARERRNSCELDDRTSVDAAEENHEACPENRIIGFPDQPPQH